MLTEIFATLEENWTWPRWFENCVILRENFSEKKIEEMQKKMAASQMFRIWKNLICSNRIQNYGCVNTYSPTMTWALLAGKLIGNDSSKTYLGGELVPKQRTIWRL